MAAITYTPQTTNSPRSDRDTSTSSLSARTLAVSVCARTVAAHRSSFRPLHPARTIAIASAGAVAQTFLPLNGPTSFPRNEPRDAPRSPAAICRLDWVFRCSPAHERKPTVGVICSVGGVLTKRCLAPGRVRPAMGEPPSRVRTDSEGDPHSSDQKGQDTRMGVLRQSGPSLARIVVSRVPIRPWIWSPESGLLAMSTSSGCGLERWRDLAM